MFKLNACFQKNAKARSDIRRKLKVLNYAKKVGNITKACRYYDVSRETFYQWKRACESGGETAPINGRRCPTNPKLRTPKHIEKLILHLRQTYHLGQKRIIGYLERCDNIKISEGAVYNVLKLNDMNKLTQNLRKRSVGQFRRYEK